MATSSRIMIQVTKSQMGFTILKWPPKPPDLNPIEKKYIYKVRMAKVKTIESSGGR